MLKQELYHKALLYTSDPDAYIEGYKVALDRVKYLLSKHLDFKSFEHVLEHEINELKDNENI